MIAFLTSNLSTTASTTRSQSRRSAMVVVALMRDKAASASAEASFSLATRRAKLLLTVATPRSSAGCEISQSRTSWPETAKVWAMPLPIVPAPTTPIL